MKILKLDYYDVIIFILYYTTFSLKLINLNKFKSSSGSFIGKSVDYY